MEGPRSWLQNVTIYDCARYCGNARTTRHKSPSAGGSTCRNDAKASGEITPYLALNTTHTGTTTGLSKMPYVLLPLKPTPFICIDLMPSATCATRGARLGSALPLPFTAPFTVRVIVTCAWQGLGGFRLLYDNISASAGNGTAVRWTDTVGIAEYWFADIHKMTEDTCPLPPYIKPSAPVLPFFIPFRALTVNGYPNVLVAGKCMATSFFVNAATRVHPNECAPPPPSHAPLIRIDLMWPTGTPLASRPALLPL